MGRSRATLVIGHRDRQAGPVRCVVATAIGEVTQQRHWQLDLLVIQMDGLRVAEDINAIRRAFEHYPRALIRPASPFALPISIAGANVRWFSETGRKVNSCFGPGRDARLSART